MTGALLLRPADRVPRRLGSYPLQPRTFLEQALEPLDGACEANNLVLVDAKLLGADKAVVHLPGVAQLTELELQGKLHTGG